MRVLLVASLLLLSGCLGGSDASAREYQTTFELAPYDVYIFDHPEMRYVGDAPHGQMMRFTNPTAAPLTIGLFMNSPQGKVGPVNEFGWAAQSGDRTVEDTLQPGESRLWLLEYPPRQMPQVRITSEGSVVDYRAQTALAEGPRVQADMHIRTWTVGVWVNGTSFYTNIESFNADPAFPAGYDRAGFGGGALPIYVYDEDRSEQPAGSKDTCHFTTITGYNELLKTQVESVPGVRFLYPEEAYTVEGAEEHFLYGQPLIFLNLVTEVVRNVGPTDDAPNPQGACFDPDNSTPALPPGLF